MAQDHDVYRRVGRGGAGNFHPAKRADQDPKDKDLEAQNEEASSSPAAVVTPPPNATPSPGFFARGGRGGAGNFVDPSQLPAGARQQEEDMADGTAEAVRASLRSNQAQGGLGGRGGAGNWKSAEQQEEEKRRRGEEEERSSGRREELERSVQEAVDKGLKMPERVYHGN